jgi:hypothetical protein
MKERFLDVIKWGLILIIAGAVFHWVYDNKKHTPGKQKFNPDWIEMKKYDGGVIPSKRPSPPTPKGYVLENDIELPRINELHGKAKFINIGTDATPQLKLGYLIVAQVNALDLSKVPTKYLKENKENNGKFRPLKLTGEQFYPDLPIKKVRYKFHFGFDLTNSEGFVLKTLEGKDNYIESGQDYTFQSVIDEIIPINIANQITNIAFVLFLEECITCFPGQ